MNRSDAAQLHGIVESILPRFIALAKGFLSLSSLSFADKTGTYVIQNIMQHVNRSDTQQLILSAMKGHEMKLAVDQLGVYVLNRCLDRFAPELTLELKKTLASQSITLSKNRFGVISLRTLYNTAPGPIQAMIRKSVFDHFAGVVYDQYGFYFLQHLVEPGVAECEASRRAIVELFCADIATFVRQKNAITIVEKCIDLCDSDRMRLARALFGNSEVYHNMHAVFLVGVRRGGDA